MRAKCLPCAWLSLIVLTACLMTGCTSSVDVPDDYYGAFINRNNANWTENWIEFNYIFQTGYVEGKGKLVLTDAPEFEGDVGFVETANYTFEGQWDPAAKKLVGTAHVTGSGVCTANCSGVDNYELDFMETWTATVSEDIQKISGSLYVLEFEVFHRK